MLKTLLPDLHMTNAFGLRAPLPTSVAVVAFVVVVDVTDVADVVGVPVVGVPVGLGRSLFPAVHTQPGCPPSQMHSLTEHSGNRLHTLIVYASFLQHLSAQEEVCRNTMEHETCQNNKLHRNRKCKGAREDDFDIVKFQMG